MASIGPVTNRLTTCTSVGSTIGDEVGTGVADASVAGTSVWVGSDTMVGVSTADSCAVAVGIGGPIVKDKTVVAPPGVPVTSLVARGDVDLGFQQLSELAGEGVDVVGSLPDEIQSLTTFSAGLARTSSQPDNARALLQFMTAPEVSDIKRRHHMDVP